MQLHWLGVGEPSAYQWEGRYFQSANVLRVEKENGFNLNTDKYNWEEYDHFIKEDCTKDIDFGEGKKNIFALKGTTILRQIDKEVQLAVNDFGKGCSVYIRLMMRRVYINGSALTSMSKCVPMWKTATIVSLITRMSHSLLLFIRVMARALIWIWKQTKSSGMKFSDDGGETFRFSFYKISMKKSNIHIKSFENFKKKYCMEMYELLKSNDV